MASSHHSGQHGSGHHATLGKDWRYAKPEQLQLWAVHGISLQQQLPPAAPGRLRHLIPLSYTTNSLRGRFGDSSLQIKRFHEEGGVDLISGLKNTFQGISVMIQWLRIHLPMQVPWVRALGEELRSHMLRGN